MRSLITGINGFAGGHLAGALQRRGHQVAGIDRSRGAQLEALGEPVEVTISDIRDAEAVQRVVHAFHPDWIFHLAAITHVGEAWKNRRETLDINVIGTSTVLEAAAGLGSKPTVVLASTGQVYGDAPDDQAAVGEDTPTRPRSPYAVSKLCAELLAHQSHEGEGVPVVIVRTFNYTGPWQAPTFVCSDFARQVAWIEAGLAEPRISVGNLDSCRDFSDVRDVVDGYIRAAEHGAPGRAYNLASGRAVRIGDVLDALRAAANVDIEVQHDNARLRKVDLRVLRGDASRARRELGWQPRIDFDETLAAVLDFWRQQAAAAPAPAS
jgi:GDP-4-dehydro-6-deoxy-D-mannose reductase